MPPVVRSLDQHLPPADRHTRQHTGPGRRPDHRSPVPRSLGPDHGARRAQIRQWSTLTAESRPDFASVNVTESGFEQVAGDLISMGVGLEDVQTDRTGEAVRDNAALIHAALRN